MKSKQNSHKKEALDFMASAIHNYDRYREEFCRYAKDNKNGDKRFWLIKLSEKLTDLRESVEKKLKEIKNANGHGNQVTEQLFVLSGRINDLIEKIKS